MVDQENGMNSNENPKPVRGYFDGCFDIMHSGHYNALRQAKSLCDILVVGVHSDAEISRNKCPPVMKQTERYGLLEHIKWIDEIVHDVPYSPTPELIRSLKCDFSVHGDDMPVGTNAGGRHAYSDLQDAGMLRVIKRTEGVSTTDLIGRMLLLTKDHFEADRGGSEPRTTCQLVKELSDSECQKPATIAEDSTDSEAAQITVLAEKQIQRNKNRQILLTTRRIAEFSPGKTPKPDDVVVYVDGSFDMFHVGYAKFLSEAKKFGTYLLVGIHDDATVNDREGTNYPIQTMHERVLNVCACKHVDEVIMGAPGEVTEDLLHTMNISVVVHGKRTNDEGNDDPFRAPEPPVEEQPRYKMAVDRGMLKTVEVGQWDFLSPEVIADRVLMNRKMYMQRNQKRGQVEDEYYAQKKNGVLTEA